MNCEKYAELENSVRALPNQPGVYQYFDEAGRLLYVGKAKNLKNRVKSYWRFTPDFRPNPDVGPRISRMLYEAISLEYIVVESEEDALILENSLIKQLKPKYNILLRDDKTYPYIYIDEGQKFPRFEITRRVVKGSKVKYYGPFPGGARALLDSIYELFPLVQKRGSLKGKKACLFYQIGKCKAPCEGYIDEKEYAEIVENAKRAIEDRRILSDMLNEKMYRLASEERFEEAAEIRDRIKVIESMKIHSDLDLANNEDIDILTISVRGERGVVLRLFIRNGKLVSTSHSFFRQTDIYDEEEAYRQALVSFYDDEMPTVADRILTAFELSEKGDIEAALKSRTGKRVSITHPKKGNKARLVELSLKNAEELLKRDSKTRNGIEKKIQTLLNLEKIPYRVEIFDNSHMMGEATIGAMVVWDENGWEKSSYRRYILESKDEYSQMREMLERRIKDFDKEPPPDLWLIDGGDTLLKLANTLLSESGVRLDTAAISKEKLDGKAYRAKGASRDIIYTKSDILRLESSDGRLQWLQRLRDEAHRFAIEFHRKRKRKDDMKISLLAKKGIGEASVRKLLNYFGSFEAIERADIDELSSVVGEKIAKSLRS